MALFGRDAAAAALPFGCWAEAPVVASAFGSRVGDTSLAEESFGFDARLALAAFLSAFAAEFLIFCTDRTRLFTCGCRGDCRQQLKPEDTRQRYVEEHGKIVAACHASPFPAKSSLIVFFTQALNFKQRLPESSHWQFCYGTSYWFVYVRFVTLHRHRWHSRYLLVPHPCIRDGMRTEA